ncbi:MAG TPA: aldehyde ferredoxin oxidoreductase C-terminal domain-containing protein [Anaerolineales bacterium]|nr:aldehyde ferredoxin oxidoreductase C-terminal domain-containing protein [Anaerolineales bacterium]
MWIVRVNMTDQSYKVEGVPEVYKYLAGRAMTSTLVADEVPPLCHPLGPNNKLVFAPGIATGTAAPTSARVSVGAKSPLTGGIKEANAGSSWAADLAVMQVKALVLEGQPLKDGKYWGLHLSYDKSAGQPKVEFFNATKYIAQPLSEVFPKVYSKFGNRISISGVGLAGEHGYANSGLVFNDQSKRATRYAGRGGLGSVLASKGVKFIVVDRKDAPGVEIVDKALFAEGRKKMTEALQTHDITKPKGGLNTYGTAVLINIMNEAGGLPTRNFSSGRFEGAAKIAGEAIFEGNKKRMGKEIYNHACSPGCIIQCSNTWYSKDGDEVASCVEYESDWALGADCGIDNLDQIAEMVRLCNEYGLDTIETGTTIAVAMEASVIPFGDGKGAIKLIHQMGQGTPLGRILGSGTEGTGKAYGMPRVPTVKGQSMPAYEPRAVKGIGITYATTTMGADHTAGYTIAPEILGVSGKQDPLSNEGKAALSRNFQAATAFIDSTGHCLFIAFAILDIASGYQGMIDECNGVFGTNWTADDVAAYGVDVLKKERAFNEAAGLGKLADRMPEFMKIEPLPPHNQVFDIPDEALDSVYGEL